MIIFLYGEDTFRSRQKLNEFREKYLREIDASGSSLTSLNGTAASFSDVSEAINSSSLLSKKRMIVVEGIFANRGKNIFSEVFEFLKQKKKDENIIIFWDTNVKFKKVRISKEYLMIDAAGREKPLAKEPLKLFKFLIDQKYSQQFNPLSNTEVMAWAKKEVEKRGGKITNQSAQLLTSLVGNNLWQINHEIDKLINYKSASKLKLEGEAQAAIEAEDVEKLVRGNFDENIFVLTDAISSRNKAQATRLLEEQIEAGLTDSYLLTMFVRQFRILLQIRQALDKDFSSRKIINLLKLHPYIVQKGISQVRNFNLETLKNILSELAEIDYKMKSGETDIQTALNLLIARI